MKILFQLIIYCCCTLAMVAQKKDTVTVSQQQAASGMLKDTAAKADSVKKKAPHSARKATIRSAIIPGWGQAYNKKYWKVPIVWGALGTCIGFFIYNRNEYVDARDAYRLKFDTTISATEALARMKPKFRPVDPEGIRVYRNGVRQNVDYSVLAFLISWGLNVVDATVDGHLKEFNVNDNLSMRINPSYIPQTRQASLSIVMRFGK
ncbi:MAG: hypothetical protein K2X48_04410 [Chitinophagaceae bacterium]|nr:hypothetical protein [Chitinophagaceae bacterium]